MVNGAVQDDKFFLKLLTREKCNTTTTSRQAAGEASFRVPYYGGATGSVPFTWESQPGTPKLTFNDNPLPPLTPPPSYQSSPRAANPSPPLLRKHSSKNSKSFFNFSKVPSKKINASNSPPASASASSSSSFSSSYSLPTTPFNARKENFKARSRSTVRLEMEEDEYEEVVGRDKSPTSTLCFGPRNARRFRGYTYPIRSVKKVVLSIVGHGNAN